ncbi:hypothetical protein QLQ12_45235, partial [Actinoplanes sp. NEAU-A12]
GQSEAPPTTLAQRLRREPIHYCQNNSNSYKNYAGRPTLMQVSAFVGPTFGLADGDRASSGEEGASGTYRRSLWRS